MSSKYSIEFDTTAVNALKAIQRNFQVKITNAIAALATDPRPSNCKKLQGTTDAYRIRIGNYRVIYVINDTIRIQKIAHRREVYR